MMNIFKTALYVVVSFILSSCSFDGTFHKPTQNTNFEDLTYFDSGNEITYIEFIEANQEIILKDSGFNTINENYSISNKYFVSSNGNRLNGWLLTSKNKEPIATILHFHGSAGNLLTQYELINPLLEFGYQIFTFDYSGYGCSEGKSTHKNVLEDAYSALEYLKNEKTIKDSKLIIYGQSYGGYLASIVGSNSQQEVDGIVIEGAFTSLKDEARHKASIFGNFVKRGIPADKEIQKNQKPILIIHSSEDELVPIQHGKKIYNNANIPKEFYEITGPHIYGLQNYPKEISSKIFHLIIKE